MFGAIILLAYFLFRICDEVFNILPQIQQYTGCLKKKKKYGVANKQCDIAPYHSKFLWMVQYYNNAMFGAMTNTIFILLCVKFQ